MESEEEEFLTAECVDTIDDANESRLSDSEDEEGQYDPTPYAFILKDILRRPLLVPSEKIHMAKMKSPPFHILLDHTVAVLWCFYSRNGHHKLGSSQLHWAIKFLEGLRNERCKYTTDVFNAIEDLENALEEVVASLQEEDILKRKYKDHVNPVRSFPPSPDSLNDHSEFTSHMSRDWNYDSFVENIENPLESSNTLNRSEIPSIILNDLLEGHPQALAQIRNASIISEDEIYSIYSNKQSIQAVKSVCSKTNEIILHKHSLIENTIQQLEEIKNLDNTMRDMICQNESHTL